MQQLNEYGKPVVDSHYVRPKRAEELIKRAHNMRQTLYVCGPTGFGKTSLIADILSRRRYTYLQTDDIEMVYSGLDALINEEPKQKETIVVIDDLHQIESDDAREKMLSRLYKLIRRKDIWLILISRATVPVWLKSLYVQNIFAIVNEKLLALAESEIRQYFNTWGILYLDADIQRMLEVLEGYPLAIRIYTLLLLPMGGNAGLSEEKMQEVLQKCTNDIYDYYDSHVFERWNVELQEFLMDLSIVEQFDVELAKILTKRRDVSALLKQAEEIGSFFVERTQGNSLQYEYHRLMKQAIRKRLFVKRSHTYIDNLYYRAGMYYEMTGDIENALSMYEQGRHEEGISNLLIKNVRKHVGAGHYWQLRRYYQQLSEDIICKSPELMAGMSMLQSIQMNDAESEKWYQELSAYAKQATGSEKKRAQMRILYLDISLPQRGSRDIIELLPKAALFFTERKNIFPEFSLTNNQPSIMDGGKDFCEWSKRDDQIAKRIGKLIELVLGDFGKGLVNLALAESYLEKGKDYFEIIMLADRGRMQASAGGKIEQVFVGVGIVSQLAVLNNHFSDAIEMLNGLELTAKKEAPHIVGNIEALKTRYYLYNGQIAEITEWMKQAPNEDEEFCTLERYSYMTKVRVYLLLGKKQRAVNLLNQIMVYVEQRERTLLWIECKILYAIALHRLEIESWITTLQEAITKAEEYHFVRILAREGAAVYKLLQDGRIVWNNKEYKAQVLRECSQQAVFYPNYLQEKVRDIALSDTALMILRLQAEGMRNEDIAKKLHMSLGNVKYHNTETYKKLGVKSKAAAITEAQKRKLI